jgi:AcrR family transcriptional regulator
MFIPMSTRSNARKPAMRLRVREAASSAILEAAEQVAARRGVEATSIAAIAEHAGVAVGTLYNYFPDRDALLSALFKARREELLPRILAAAETTKALPFEQRLRAYMAGVIAAFEDSRTFCKVAISAEGTTAKFKAKPAVLPAIVGALTEILHPITGAASSDYARMIFGAFKEMLQARIETDRPLPPAAPLIVDTFLKGIARR